MSNIWIPPNIDPRQHIIFGNGHTANYVRHVLSSDPVSKLDYHTFYFPITKDLEDYGLEPYIDENNPGDFIVAANTGQKYIKALFSAEECFLLRNDEEQITWFVYCDLKHRDTNATQHIQNQNRKIQRLQLQIQDLTIDLGIVKSQNEQAQELARMTFDNYLKIANKVKRQDDRDNDQ